jgi:hypothetical protein
MDAASEVSYGASAMRELGVLGGERLREPNDLDDEVGFAHAAVGRRPCAAELIATAVERGGASPPHAAHRRIYQSPAPFTVCWSCVTKMASAEAGRQ